MEAGRVIGGKYRLRREIGKGAMGSVWAAMHESLGRAIAVKFLRPSGLNPETAAARFVAEARMAAAVKHRFIVDIFDFGLTEDGVSYMVLELLEGEELGERMYYGPPVLVSDAIRFIGQCLGGLSAVHEAGIVHRDLKPENIFMMQDADGMYPKLLDFGISKRSEGDGYLESVSLRPPRMGGGRPVQLTQPGTVIGTPWYMAPEQLRGRRDLDARADIYGMGIILWEWLTGRVPYDDDNIGDLVMNMMGSGTPDLMAVRPELGEELSLVLQRSMALNRDDRFQSAQEMRDALQKLPQAMPEAWTVVQRSIATLSSREVLGVVFPSETPEEAANETRNLRSANGRTAAMTGGDATMVLAEPRSTTSWAASAVTGAPAAVSSDRMPMVFSWEPPWLRSWLQRLTGLPAVQRAGELYRRYPGYVVAGAISVFLLVSLVLFSSGHTDGGPAQNPEDAALLGDRTFVTSAEAQDASARRTIDSMLAASPASDRGLRRAEDAAPDAGVYATADAARPEAVERGAPNRPLRRTTHKPKTKPKRLIRSLDF